MASSLPTPVAAALGLVPAVLEGVRRLPGKAVQLPVLAVSSALTGLDTLHKEYVGLADRGERLVARLRGQAVEQADRIEDALEGATDTVLNAPAGFAAAAQQAAGDVTAEVTPIVTPIADRARTATARLAGRAADTAERAAQVVDDAADRAADTVGDAADRAADTLGDAADRAAEAAAAPPAADEPAPSAPRARSAGVPLNAPIARSSDTSTPSNPIAPRMTPSTTIGDMVAGRAGSNAS